jgi:hypothetical protein
MLYQFCQSDEFPFDSEIVLNEFSVLRSRIRCDKTVGVVRLQARSLSILWYQLGLPIS